MQYIELLRGLFIEDVHYLLCGGLAVNIYGIPRMTSDIDIIIGFEKDNFLKFEKVMVSLNYQKISLFPLYDLLDEKKRKELIDKKNLTAFSFYNPAASYMNLDVLLDVPLPFGTIWKNKMERQIDDFKVYTVSIDHLIEMKKYSDRMQDKQDIIYLTRLQKKMKNSISDIIKESGGFYYEVSDQQIEEHLKRSLREILEWLEDTSELIYLLQTEEERNRKKVLRNKPIQ